MLSLLCYTYAYTGGAHGSYDYFGQNFSTVTGKALSIDDLTDDPEALRAALTEHILAAAKEDAEELFDVEGFTERVYDTDAWYLTDDELVIVAQVGEIAAGARGKVEFWPCPIPSSRALSRPSISPSPPRPLARPPTSPSPLPRTPPTCPSRVRYGCYAPRVRRSTSSTTA